MINEDSAKIPTSRRTFSVRGRVQGVGFRWWTRDQALRLGLEGSVRNLENGSVMVIAEGEEAALDQLRDQLQIGPPAAVVEELVEEVSEATGEFRGFEIMR